MLQTCCLVPVNLIVKEITRISQLHDSMKSKFYCLPNFISGITSCRSHLEKKWKRYPGKEVKYVMVSKTSVVLTFIQAWWRGVFLSSSTRERSAPFSNNNSAKDKQNAQFLLLRNRHKWSVQRNIAKYFHKELDIFNRF